MMTTIAGPNLARRCRTLCVCLAFGLAIAMSFAHRAEAGAYSGGFTATMDQGSIDTYGYFGTPGANLSGATITGTFSYDPTAFTDSHCTVTVPSEGCWFGPVTITETVGSGTITFQGSDPSVSGLDIYTGLPAATSNTDQFTLTSTDAKGANNSPPLDTTTLDFWSKTVNFLTDPTNDTPVFSLTNADMASNAGGTINLTSLGAENLAFQFVNSTDGAEAGQGVEQAPEPGSLLLLASGLVALAAWRAMPARRRTA